MNIASIFSNTISSKILAGHHLRQLAKGYRRGGTLLVLALAAMSMDAQADHWIAMGSAPSSDGGGFSIAALSKTSETFGWGVGIVFNSEMAGKDVNDYPVPHSDYTYLGTKRTGNALGLDFYWFPTGNSTWRPYAGLGMYYDQRAEIAQSNATGWYYIQKEKSAVHMGGELGLQYRTSGDWLWGLSFHTVRGGSLSIGWNLD